MEGKRAGHPESGTGHAEPKRSGARRWPVVGFTGPSGIGKTTLLERVIVELQGRSLRVGVVKRSSHHIEVDRPGKDSWRMFHAGAAAVALSSSGQLTTFVRHAPDSTPTLDDALASLPDDLDVVLVEGYLSQPLPRYVLLPSGEEPSRPYLSSGGPVLRVIHPPQHAPDAPPEYEPALVASLVTQIAAIAKASAERPKGHSADAERE